MLFRSEDNSLTPNGSVLDKTLIMNNNNILNQLEAPSHRYHFAITGTVFHIIKTYYPELLPRILVRGTVFARMSPEQKQQLVELLQGLGYFVGAYNMSVTLQFLSRAFINFILFL